MTPSADVFATGVTAAACGGGAVELRAARLVPAGMTPAVTARRALTHTTQARSTFGMTTPRRIFRNDLLAAVTVAALGLRAALVPAAASEPPIRQGPQPLQPAARGVGRLVPAFAFTDLDGGQHALVPEADPPRLTVFCFTSTTCPLSRKYLPTLADLAASAEEGVRFVLVNPIASDRPDPMRAAAELLPTALYVHDGDQRIASLLGATTTADTVVVDDRRTVVYHGAVDDQYGLGYARPAPRRRYLADAVTATLAGKRPAITATTAPGCDLGAPRSAAASTVTYHGRISRLLQQHCLECHRDGGIGPFSLERPEDVVAHAGMIETVVSAGTMPPWFAAPQAATESDESARQPLVWANDRSLAAAARDELLAWLRGGRPLGNPADAPAPHAFPDGWQIGQPDAVWEFSEPVAVPATGVMPYRYVTIETELAEPKWVQAIEVQPGNPEVVHHVLVHVEPPGDAGRDRGRRERGGFWAAYVPGQSVLDYPEGFGKLLPAGARLVFQMHYTPVGMATTDRTRLGVVFATEPPRHEVRVVGLANGRIAIPPGAPRHREEATLRLPADATLLGFLPHMHLRGTACRYELTRGDGRRRVLLDIPRYDFNWQLLYRYAEPLPLQAGDLLQFTAWYDNSAANPANPDPAVTVRWGEQTFDEMLLGYVEYFLPGVEPGEGGSLRRRQSADNRSGPGQPAIDAVFKRLDQDRSGSLTLPELPPRLRPRFKQLDRNQDGAVSLEEARRFRR